MTRLQIEKSKTTTYVVPATIDYNIVHLTSGKRSVSALTRSFRYIFVPVMMTFICIAATQLFAYKWQLWLPTINELPYYLYPIVAVLALQFNYARLSFLSVLLLIYYLYEQGLLPELTSIEDLRDHIFLSGTLVIAFFSINKDRAILSTHTIKTFVSIAFCVVLGFAWLFLITQLSAPTTPELPPAFNLLAAIYVPVGVSSIVVCIYATWRKTAIDSMMVVTLFIWLFYYYYPSELPLSILLCMLAVTYLCAILSESYHLAYRDDLTGLSSRRALNTMALSLNSHYSVAMVDIDHFKSFNDTYGHDVGDQVLQLIASKLTKVKGSGKVYRYGGEEFTIVFPNRDVEFVLPYLNELRCIIRDYDIVLRNEHRKTSNKSSRNTQEDNLSTTVNVTISIGVAEHHGQLTFAQTLKLADKALYIAKKNGRNRVFA